MRRGRPLTAEQQAKSDARRAQFKALAQTIGAMSDEQRMQMAARMAAVATIEGRTLSVHNVCLLACQRPDATMVGGFQQWRAAGRMVRKGEHGAMIWAPVRHAEDSSRQPGEMSSRGDRPGFIMVTVFDVAQTDAVESTVVAS